MNALTSGLSSKRAYIPHIDGHPEEVQQLEADLRREYKPRGTEEGFYFEEMFKAILRMRRATRYESGSIRDAAYSNPNRPYPGDLTSARINKLNILKDAQQEVRNTEDISRATYEKVLPLITWTARRAGFSEGSGKEEIGQPEQEFDLSQFSADLKQQILIETVELEYWEKRDEERVDDYFAKQSLPNASVMNNLFRYENEVLKRFERARNNLLECQQRRLEKNDA